MAEVKLPEIADGVTRAVISMWHFGEGDTVRQDDDFVEFVTDKATFNMPSPFSGKVTKLMFAEGEAVNVGEVIAIIEKI
ncbi:MAG: lipoyl domain-containing protein [Candidatus Omnitrophica bacterium]|nr:lipoyl domain-containing protein [Candidatus Omnitrophota bacterium]